MKSKCFPIVINLQPEKKSAAYNHEVYPYSRSVCAEINNLILTKLFAYDGRSAQNYVPDEEVKMAEDY